MVSLSWPEHQANSGTSVLMDAFSGWVEAFPTRTKTAAEVAKLLLKEAIPRLGLPGSLLSNKGPEFLSPASSNKRDNKCPGHKMDLALSLETPTTGGK